MSIPEQKKPLLLILLLTLLVSISWIPYLQTLFPHLSYGDEGVIVQGAYRIYNGQIPYKDFSAMFTPGAYYWTALLFSIFGPTFLAVRLGVLVIAATILLTTCFILRAYGVWSLPSYLLAAVFLAHFGGPYWFIASHHWVGLALSLISLLLLIPQKQTPPRTARILLSGAFAAATALTLQHLGGIWILCALASFWGLPRHERRHYFMNFFAGILLLTIPVVIYFATTAGISTLIYDLITYPMTQYHKIAAHKGIDLSYFGDILDRITTAWRANDNLLDWTRFAAITSLFIGVIVVNLLPFLGLAGLAFLWIKNKHPRIVLLTLTAFFCTQYLKVLFRFTDQTMVIAAPGALIIIIMVADQLRQKKTSKKFVFTFNTLWIGLFICISVATLSFHILAPRSLTITPAGPVYSLSTADHQTLQYLNRFFSERKKYNETVFCHPYSPMLYFLFHAKNPTKHDTMGYPSGTDKQRAEIIQQIENNDNRWVILTTQVPGDPLLSYFNGHYKIKARLPFALVLEKK